jgi:hypothetical protein
MSHIQPMTTLPRAAQAPPGAKGSRGSATVRHGLGHDAAVTSRPTGVQRRGVPFRDVEECIIWTIKALGDAAEVGDGSGRAVSRICEPIEVVRCLDTLYRRRRIDLRHARILRIWAHRGRPPRADAPNERSDSRLWREATERLEWPLRSLGIIS